MNATLLVAPPPPFSNTGGETPGKESGASSSSRLGVASVVGLVDWLEYTYHPEDESVEPDKALLGLPKSLSWRLLPNGRNGYLNAEQAGGITVCWNGGTPGMGWHVILTGDGCRELEVSWMAERSPVDWSGWLAYLLALGCKVSRVDVALDDRDGQLDVEHIGREVKAGNLSTHWQKHTLIESGAVGCGDDALARTVYLGSNKSDAMLRIYDKRAEQRQKGRESILPWTRVELQTRNAKAQAVVKCLAEGSLASIAGMIRGLVEFKVRGEGEHRERWAVAPWWDTFLRSAARVRLSVIGRLRTLASALRTLVRQYAPTMALLMMNAGGDTGCLTEIARVGQKRLTPRHLAMLPAAA